MDAQPVLGFLKIEGIDGREENLKVLRIVVKTDVIFDIEGREEISGQSESNPGSEV
jgi:hypothetical protein